MADADTGEILGAKDPHGRYLPASTLKTLTAVTLIPRLDPCQIYTPTAADLHAECTCVGVAAGVAYRIRMLFTGMLIYSGNDAANTLAGAYGGVDKTVAAMNAEAHYLKAYDTQAGTPSGLDTPGERSSAYDLALIARAGLAMPDFASYVSTRHVLFPVAKDGKTETKFTHVKLLPNYDGAIGIKNGFTVAAQATYVGAATRNGHTIIATLMHSTVGTAVWHEDAALLDWGFAAIGKATPVGQLVDPDQPPAPSSAASAAAGTTTSAGEPPPPRTAARPAVIITKESIVVGERAQGQLGRRGVGRRPDHRGRPSWWPPSRQASSVLARRKRRRADVDRASPPLLARTARRCRSGRSRWRVDRPCSRTSERVAWLTLPKSGRYFSYAARSAKTLAGSALAASNDVTAAAESSFTPLATSTRGTCLPSIQSAPNCRGRTP